MMNKINLPWLTSLRMPAALFVFIYHIQHITDWIAPKNIFSVGYLGVSLFFILSGFVLAWSYNPQYGIKEFYLRRFARVYPLHLFFLLIAVLLPVVSGSRSFKQFIPNLLLIQSWIPDWNYIFSYNSVSWSLSCEFFFYAIAPFIFINIIKKYSLKKSSIFLFLWFVVSSTVGGVVASYSNYLDVVVYSNPLARSGEFILGILACIFVKRIIECEYKIKRYFQGKFILISVSSGTLIFIYFVSKIGINQSINSFISAPVFAMLIIVLAINNIPGRSHRLESKAKISRLLEYFGKTSFAFYLIHELVIINIYSLDLFNGNDLNMGLTLVVVSLFSSLVLAIVAHEFVEKKIQNMIISKYSSNRG